MFKIDDVLVNFEGERLNEHDKELNIGSFLAESCYLSLQNGTRFQ